VLDSYRLLGRSGLRVSPLALGTMTFGWGADRDTARAIFDAYVGRGGNFVDTANGYASGTSEQMVGEFAESRREELVIATKYSMPMRSGDPNSGGNSRKSMVRSVEDSLTRPPRLHELGRRGHRHRRSLVSAVLPIRHELR
jgi:aryl-alcohol dehydrogenase-like predicted oxidoreductase